MKKKLISLYAGISLIMLTLLMLTIPAAQARGGHGGGHGGRGGGRYHGGGRGFRGRGYYGGRWGWGGGYGYGYPGWGWGGYGYPYYGGWGYPYYGYPSVGVGFTIGGSSSSRKDGVYRIINKTNRVLIVSTTRDSARVRPGYKVRLEYSKRILIIRSENPPERIKIRPLSRTITIVEREDGTLHIED